MRKVLFPLNQSIILIALFLLSTIYAPAEEPRPSESQVEAAYLYNFGKFVTWPADRPYSEAFEICILGKDPFGLVLDSTVAGESIGNKKIEVKRLADLQQATSCSILFVSSSEESHLATISDVAQHLSLLTVSTIRHFAERGGTIGLVAQQDRIRFEVNLRAADQCHLVLSSELLKVATRVIEAPSGK